MVEKSTTLTGDMKDFINNQLKTHANDAKEFIETGVVGFDLALTNGKGMPNGSSILLWAEPGCGKSTLCGDTALRLIKKHKAEGKPYKVLYLCTEDSESLLRGMGLGEFWGEDFLYVNNSLTWRQIEVFYEAVLRGYDKLKDVRMVIIDSINNVLSDQNLSKSIADGDFGTKAKERGNFYSKFLPRCSEKGVTSIFIAQARTKQDAGMMEDKRKAAASYADLHNVEIILKCGKRSDQTYAAKKAKQTVFKTVNLDEKYIMSMVSMGTGVKNRFFNGYPSEVMIMRGRGVENSYTVLRLLEGNGFVKKKGGWYNFSDELCELFGLSSSKLRYEAIKEEIASKIGDLVNFLKEKGRYCIEIVDKEDIVISDDDEEDNSEVPFDEDEE